MSPVTVLVTYRTKKGKERAFLSILKRHWSALNSAKLVTSTRTTNLARDRQEVEELGEDLGEHASCAPLLEASVTGRARAELPGQGFH